MLSMLGMLVEFAGGDFRLAAGPRPQGEGDKATKIQEGRSEWGARLGLEGLVDQQPNLGKEGRLEKLWASGWLPGDAREHGWHEHAWACQSMFMVC